MVQVVAKRTACLREKFREGLIRYNAIVVTKSLGSMVFFMVFFRDDMLLEEQDVAPDKTRHQTKHGTRQNTAPEEIGVKDDGCY